MANSSTQRGASLLEALVALALVGVALLMGMALYAQQRRIEQRLAAQRDADRALASVLEAARAGLPLVSGPLDAAPFVGSAAAPPALTLAVEPDDADPSGRLLRVRVIAVYTVAGHPFRRTLESLVWRPQP